VAALVAVTPTNTGAVATPAAVAASDTVAQSVLGPRGATLYIVNTGAGTDNITISDNGATAAGNQLTGNTISASVANAGVAKVFDLSPEQVNPATGLITITHSQPTGVAYTLIPNGL
jgi:hypothetical protein